MKLPDIKAILGIPFVHSLAQKLVRGKGNHLFVKRYVRPEPDDRVLDIGCGPADILTELPSVDYIGFDIDPRLIEAAKKKHGNRGQFFCAQVNEQAVSTLENFDLVLATGVIHHLADDEALALFRLARNCLKPGGRLITWDCCFVDEQSAFSRFLMARDRGRFVRTRSEYEHLAGEIFTEVESTIDDDLVRIPYPSLVMECVADYTPYRAHTAIFRNPQGAEWRKRKSVFENCSWTIMPPCTRGSAIATGGRLIPRLKCVWERS